MDLLAGELRKADRRIRIQEQPFRVLVLLLERPGEIVGREDIIRSLWPDGTFVDYEHSVNTAVRKLREALGDDPDSPRFVETVPRRGYRFIGPVNNGPVNNVVEGAAPRPGETSGDAVLVLALTKKHRSVLAGGAAVLLVVIAILAYWLRPQLPSPTVSGYVPLTHDGQPKTLVGTDGARVYFYDNSFTYWMAQVSVAGGELAPIPSPSPRMLLKSVSPDGSTLLVEDDVLFGEGQLWALPVPGGSARRLADIRGHSGAWSPNGEKLAYANGNDLFLANADGTQSSKLVSAPGRIGAYQPAWSPDGSEIRFSVVDPKTQFTRLWQVSANGTNLHPLHPKWYEANNECCGQWTADGKYFLFSARRQVWAVREAKAFFHKINPEPVQLTAGAATYNHPILSKDGKKIYVTASQPRGELERFDSKSKAYLSYLGGISAQDVAFSRDGEWVAYVTFPGGILWRSKVDGSDKLQLSSDSVYAYNPRWSPDGKEIAFWSAQPGKDSRIFLISADGGTPTELAPNAPRNQADPAWSPNGDAITFGVGWGRPSDAAIFTLDRKTGQASKNCRLRRHVRSEVVARRPLPCCPADFAGPIDAFRFHGAEVVCVSHGQSRGVSVLVEG